MTSIAEIDATGLASLTPKEREVLQFLSKGLPAHEISALMGMSRWTTQDHTKAIFRKLDVSTRVEAAVIAAKAGWV